jgi:A/G-specific adenine glycosylase
MLQQTRVETVVPYYERFLSRYPTVHALADAPIDDVLAMWSGLGYYRRARMLHAAAQQVSTEHGGAFPRTAEGLACIKGIGPYTAGAVASIAFGALAPLVDGNVARVLSRLFAVEEDVRGGKGLRRIWSLAGALVADLGARDPGAWNQALMELGATVCVPRTPRCLVCPVRDACEARARGLEQELPRLKPKAKAIVQRRWALVAHAPAGEESAILLGRRREALRFGGLWEPPSLDRDEGEDESAALGRFEALLGVRLEAVERAGEVTHVLSHRRLEVVVLRGAIAGPRRGASVPFADGAGEYDTFERVAATELASPSHAAVRGEGKGKGQRGRGLSTLARKLLAKG